MHMKRHNGRARVDDAFEKVNVTVRSQVRAGEGEVVERKFWGEFVCVCVCVCVCVHAHMCMYDIVYK